MLLGIAWILTLACIYTVVGLWTAWLFRKDKKASENGEWRISEKKLLTFMWLFGVFGAAVGMRVYHHKTNKPLFQGSLSLSLALHVALIVYSCIQVF